MSKITKYLRHFICEFETILAKLRLNGLTSDGIIYKQISTQIIIREGGKIKLGRNVRFQRNVSLTSIGSILSIGDNVSFNRNCIVISRESIQIGDNVIFGPGVTIYDHDHIFTDEGIQSGYKHGTIVIEDGCWIAANVTILRNTHIGRGSVIGAGAVVKGDIPSHSLVTGNRGLTIVPIKRKQAQSSRML